MEPMSSNKRSKSNRNRSISKLPDVILQRILSFLPTKDAVRTSVLSRRCEYLWTSIPNLEFRQKHSDDFNFIEFVHRAISLHISDIKQFSLDCCVAGDEPCVKRWMSAVVRRNVEELHIDTDIAKEPLQLPQCLFVSASLTTLDLCICCTLKFPPSICLSSLKHLHLAYITFTDDDSTQKFFSGCPVLETVCLAKCNWTNLCSVGLYAPKLWVLEIIEDVNEGTDFEASDGCEVMIFAPSLQTFEYDGAFLNDYCVYDSPILNEAVIHLGSEEWVERPRIVFYRLYKLLKGISNVKQLLLSSDIVEELNFAKDPLPYMPSFHNLSTLTFSKSIIELDCAALMKMLQSAQSLEKLCFKAGIKLSSHCKNDKRILESSTPDFLPRLKTVEVWKNGNNKKLFVDAIEILLKRFGVLDKLIVHAKEISGYKEELKKELLELPKASKVCQIFLVSSSEDVK